MNERRAELAESVLLTLLPHWVDTAIQHVISPKDEAGLIAGSVRIADALIAELAKTEPEDPEVEAQRQQTVAELEQCIACLPNETHRCYAELEYINGIPVVGTGEPGNREDMNARFDMIRKIRVALITHAKRLGCDAALEALGGAEESCDS